MHVFADAKASANQQVKKRKVNKEAGEEHIKKSRNEAMN
jgi:hypothetical protein